jgi:non-specific serine/threonine protein kinase
VLRGISWERVVADEAQQIKNAVGQQARAVRALRARHRIALTGTPVENRLADLHAVLDFANPGMFGSAVEFRERYSVPIERHRDPRAAEQLRRRTGLVLLRRSKTDPAIAAELPDKVEISVPCTLTVEQAALYRAVVDDLLDRVTRSRGAVRKGVVLPGLGKLKQICDHPAVFLKDSSRPGGRSGKLARLESLLETAIAEGDRALCFTQYARFGHLLQPYLTRRLGREVLFLHGGTPRGERDAMVRRFGDRSDGTDAGAPAVFLLSLRAGGTGLNLTAANHVVHLDRWWNPAVEDQATDRAFRIGQRRGVQVRRLVCVGTVEERIDEIIGAKRSLAELAVASDLGALTELSVDELAELIRWDPDA